MHRCGGRECGQRDATTGTQGDTVEQGTAGMCAFSTALQEAIPQFAAMHDIGVAPRPERRSFALGCRWEFSTVDTPRARLHARVGVPLSTRALYVARGYSMRPYRHMCSAARHGIALCTLRPMGNMAAYRRGEHTEPTTPASQYRAGRTLSCPSQYGKCRVRYQAATWDYPVGRCRRVYRRRSPALFRSLAPRPTAPLCHHVKATCRPLSARVTEAHDWPPNRHDKRTTTGPHSTPTAHDGRMTYLEAGVHDAAAWKVWVEEVDQAPLFLAAGQSRIAWSCSPAHWNQSHEHGRWV